MRKQVTNFGICIFIFAISFTDLRVLYAPFQYAPDNWGSMAVQSLILGTVHAACCIFPIIMHWPRLLIIAISLLSTNASFWASARELSFSIASDQPYLVVYEHIYLLTILITLIVFFFWWKKSDNLIIKRDSCSFIFLLGTAYFFGISFLPLYENVNHGHLYLAAYLYCYSQIFIILLFAFLLVCYLCKAHLVNLHPKDSF